MSSIFVTLKNRFKHSLNLVLRFKPKIKGGQNGNVEMEANPIYEMLTPLRCVLAKTFAPENWKVVEAMEQGGTSRMDHPTNKMFQNNGNL